jgi:hypothetical protein
LLGEVLCAMVMPLEVAVVDEVVEEVEDESLLVR